MESGKGHVNPDIDGDRGVGPDARWACGWYRRAYRVSMFIVGWFRRGLWSVCRSGASFLSPRVFVLSYVGFGGGACFVLTMIDHWSGSFAYEVGVRGLKRGRCIAAVDLDMGWRWIHFLIQSRTYKPGGSLMVHTSWRNLVLSIMVEATRGCLRCTYSFWISLVNDILTTGRCLLPLLDLALKATIAKQKLSLFGR